MKKLVLIISAVVLLFTFSACSATEREADDRIVILCTIFPQFDWVRQVIGEEHANKFNLSLLLDGGIDMHSYSPSVQDIMRIKTADIFIYVGGNSDSWVEDVLIDANPDMTVLNLIKILGDDVLIFGDFCDTDCNEDHEHSTSGETQFHADEHIWTSLRHTQKIILAIAGILSEVDPENAQIYNANAESYITELSKLDAEFQAVADAATVRTLVFADRFPFRYMMNDLNLDYYAAFSGCSAETEASFATVISLANRINQLNLSVVMVTAASDQAIAETVIRSTETKDQKILVLDDMKTAASSDSYLTIMRSNLNVLKEALA